MNQDLERVLLPQQVKIVDTVKDIIDSLDEHAAQQLLGGGERDLNQITQMLLEETVNVFSNGGSIINSSSFDYLDKFSASVEETFRCKNFNFFVNSCLPEFDMGWFHLEWGNFIHIFKEFGILASRDHSKSYTFSFAYPIWQMYRYRMKGLAGVPALKEYQLAKKGMIITNESSLSKTHLGLIKEGIENNDVLRERLLPDSRKEGWGAYGIVCKNGAELKAKSSRSRLRGNHPTWMVIDDFLDESSLYSQQQRDKAWNIYSAVIIPMLSPGGQMITVGTPFFEKDMYGKIKEEKMFPIFEYPAIFPDGSLLFPERHTFKGLLKRKSALGNLVFSREYLVKPITDGATIFPYEILNLSIRNQDSVKVVRNIDSSPRKYLRIIVGCDFAISSTIGADYSVFTIGGVDELGLIHVLNCWRKSGASYSEQIAALKKINRDFRPELFVVETNGMQEIFLQMLQDAGLPVVGKHTGENKKSLYKGVPSLAALFETSRIKFPYGDQQSKDLTDLYFSELNSITYIQDTGKLESVTQHDDTSMSLWQLIRGVRGSLEDFDFSWLPNSR